MKKKLVVFILVICLCIPFVSSLTSCALIDKVFNKKFDLANSVIKNFANYTSIGAAYVKENSNDNNAQPLSVGNGKSLASPFTVTSFDDKKDKKDEKIKLVGKDKNGKYEEIEFEKDGEDIEQTWNVSDIVTLGKFVFVKYAKNSRTFNEGAGRYISNLNSGGSYATYIIDSFTGKVYPTKGMGLYNSLYFNNMHCIEDVLYYLCRGAYKACNVYKIYIEKENLVVEKLIDNTNLNFYGHDGSLDGPPSFLVDCYGNIFLRDADSSDGYYIDKNKKLEVRGGYSYIIDASKKLKTLDNAFLAKSITGEVFYLDRQKSNFLNEEYEYKKFNKECELIDLKENEEIVWDNYELVSENGNIKYYFLMHGYYLENKYNSLVKTIWDENGNFTTERFILDRNYKEYAFTQNRIYFLDTQSIFYYDLNTNTYHELLSDYVFNSIKTGYDNDIIFTGLDYSLKLVNGTIKDDGTVNVEVSDSNYEIIYIKPLNI